uniref:Methyltransferase domain-containing protein n=1 Tax=Fibrocapsa japonica TaxID=94617 RepID=A0A7S2V4Q5_9STRA|mmetsp:Transcript_4240/g.6336  ORF Transcript_4240/g.6336 Transcript_4240/m.6336 type:complete len:408 (+) Transcript_4240:164-1387(+)|eukprot:CAMPEP_0113943552 /NCGR_PEP_ID=MMETSP1339-20121228/26009_1 /TAXON_ID=94617 /ORGANISM="Fibrocapsa japonica" /LENGTH=407 /DNA_ID=CAMNT_0000948455 /DNA_START=153 /DNA_END=1376 /DNA_ORIENTATION=- /assembly_acc=CAM_ASM_000762
MSEMMNGVAASMDNVSMEEENTKGGNGHPNTTDVETLIVGNSAAKAADYANYFCSYAFLYHQKQMLTDHQRMRAYYSAVMQNKEVFQNAVVLDVGTGSGVLAAWAAMAGAKKVYAVEFTDMATHARRLVEANGQADKVEVIKGSVEELDLAEKVDIIISEWMGYFLLRESMVDSLIKARDRFLKPDGLLFPSHATMYWAPICFEEERLGKQQEYIQSLQEWHNFKAETKERYGITMATLEADYEQEQRHYYINTASWSELHPDQVVCPPQAIKHLDLHTCTQPEAAGVAELPFCFPCGTQPTRVSGFAGWFTTDFKGRVGRSLGSEVVLSTGPEAGYTHWGQQVFYLAQPLDLQPGDKILGTFRMERQKENIRLYDLYLTHKVKRAAPLPGNGEAEDQPVVTKYELP